MQQRVQFVHTQRPDDGWPPVDDASLVSTLDTWLAPLLVGATGRSDLEVLSMMTAFDVIIGHGRRNELDRLVPAFIELAGRRRCPIRYEGELAVVSSRAQDFFGMSQHPMVLDGALPVTVELLSPANRPIQRTADLPGFWSGSWSEVRKEMAGRYPKHSWPVDPSSAS
jgi:ATP-dependent helicase HrpB